MNVTKSLLGNAAGYKLFFNERDSDVSIKVVHKGKKCHFPAHKLVLSTMSEVFRNMLDADMLEKSTRTIIIEDSNPHAIKQFLKYLYMGVVDFSSWYEATSLLKVAHKYSVQTLVNLCETYLLSSVNFKNVCSLYELSRTYSLKSLEVICQDLILHAGFIVSCTDGFFHLKSVSLDYFLCSPLFNVENEGSLLTSLREWAVCECSRKCIPLTISNILAAMEPFLKNIQWQLIPEGHRTYVPVALVEKTQHVRSIFRKAFHLPHSLRCHIHHVKFSLELGAYHDPKKFAHGILSCLKFSVDSHAFLTGFRVVGLFHRNSKSTTSPSLLIFGREDGKRNVECNLNSLTWTNGKVVGQQVWREMLAYLPYPIRVDPFSTYFLNLSTTRPIKPEFIPKWPKTRLDTETIATNLGNISITAHGTSAGVTQLFILPALPYRKICNKDE